MNKYQQQVDANGVWNTVELYSGLSHDLAEQLEKGLDVAQKVVDSKNLATICKTTGKKFETVGNAIGKVEGNKGLIDSLETIGNAAGIVAGVLGGISDVARLAQDKNSTPWEYVGTTVKTVKNITDKIPVLGNIMHITDFAFNSINMAIEMAKDKDTKVDWTRYGGGKVMDVLTFIPGVGQLLSFIGSSMDFFLQSISRLWNVNKMDNGIRLQNANWEAE